MKKTPDLRSPSLRKRLARLKMLVLDVDGVMTDSQVFWIKDSGWTRSFNIKDGYGIKLLQRAGIEVCMISGGSARDARERAKYLGIERAYFGSEDKLSVFERILKETGLTAQQVGFIGDELFDIPVLERAGFAATVPDAPVEVKRIAHYVTRTLGGSGAVREVADGLLEVIQTKRPRT